MGAIVYPLQKHIEKAGFSVVTKYTAHGIGRRQGGGGERLTLSH